MSLWTRMCRRARKEQDLDEEIAAHLAIETQERIEQGDGVDEARAGARSDFGSVALAKERMRDAWGWTWLERLLSDQRYILRHLRRNPGFAVVSIFVLAVGLGAITALFSIVNSVLLEPLGFAHEERLYSVVNVPPANAGTNRLWHINARHVHEWRAHCTSCEDVAMAEGIGLNLTGGTEPERVSALRSLLQLLPDTGRPAGARTGFSTRRRAGPRGWLRRQPKCRLGLNS